MRSLRTPKAVRRLLIHWRYYTYIRLFAEHLYVDIKLTLAADRRITDIGNLHHAEFDVSAGEYYYITVIMQA